MREIFGLDKALQDIRCALKTATAKHVWQRLIWIWSKRNRKILKGKFSSEVAKIKEPVDKLMQAIVCF